MSLPTIMITLEKAPEVDDRPPTLGTLEELLVGIGPGVGSFYDPPFRPERVGGAFLGDRALQPAFLQEPTGDVRVVNPIEVDTHRLWQPSQRLQSLQGGGQQRRVVVVGRGCQRPKGMPYPSTIIERLRPCFPRSTGLLPAFSPPHGAFVMQQSTATSESSSPMVRS